MANADFLNNNLKWARLFHTSPDLFHVRYFWSNKIMYRIHNQDVSTGWIETINDNSRVGQKKDTYISDKFSWRALGLAILASINKIRRKKRLTNVDLSSLFACPNCHGDFTLEDMYFVCNSCNSKYQRLPHPDFTKVC